MSNYIGILHAAECYLHNFITSCTSLTSQGWIDCAIEQQHYLQTYIYNIIILAEERMIRRSP